MKTVIDNDLSISHFLENNEHASPVMNSLETCLYKTSIGVKWNFLNQVHRTRFKILLFHLTAGDCVKVNYNLTMPQFPHL